jgi:hypothetical protein
MAVPETLVHPFATAKIVVWPATCSVRRRLIIAARSGDAWATPRCALTGVAANEPATVVTATKAANIFFILTASFQGDAFVSGPGRSSSVEHRNRPTECTDRGLLRVDCCKVLVRCLSFASDTAASPAASVEELHRTGLKVVHRAGHLDPAVRFHFS